MTDSETDHEDRSADYIFTVQFHLASQSSVRLDPKTFETTLFIPATPPGKEGWLFFRDTLWRGAVSDQSYMCEVAESKLGVPVDHIAFRELRTTTAYLDALTDAIAAELDTQPTPFGNATSTEEVLKNYLGSSIHVRPSDQ